MSILFGSNVLPLLLRNSRFTLIPPKIYDIKTNLYTRAAGYVMLCTDGDEKGAPVQGELARSA